MRAIPHVWILGVFYPPKRLPLCIYTRFVESGKSEARQGSASEKCIWAMFYSFKRYVILHFSRSRPRGASKYQVFLRKHQWFRTRKSFRGRSESLLFLRNNLYFWGVAVATPRKVQTDYLFKAISEAPNRFCAALHSASPDFRCHFQFNMACHFV